MKDSELRELEQFAFSLPQETRNQVAQQAVSESLDRQLIEEAQLPKYRQEAIDIYKKYGSKPVNGGVPCVYSVRTLEGVIKLGVCFQPVTAKILDLFHYDHGVGIDRNNDAIILWMPEV